MDLALQVQRFEQQLSAFEKLHKDELEEFERKFFLFKKLHEEEVKLLKDELARLKDNFAN